MMKLSYLCISLIVICSMHGSLRAQDPKMILFETFTNSFAECTANNDLDAEIKQTLNPNSNPNAARIIHLNYHITNVGDPMCAKAPSASAMIAKISGLTGGTQPILCAAVDRTNFPPNGKLTGIPPGGQAQWTSRISSEVKITPTVSIKLLSAQIDKISSDASSRLIATVEVTGAQTPDTMAIHYAVLQDNITYAQCPDSKPPGPTHHNNVVRYVTLNDSLLNFKTQTKNTVTFVQNISKTIKDFDLTSMKLVAWVEDHNGGDYTVAQAALLQLDLNDLPAPPSSLVLNSTILDDAVFAPNDLITILFDKVSIDSVKIEYSSDGGSTWQTIGNTHDTRLYWNAPNITTTQGKIRISDLSNGNLISKETRTFTIKQADHSLSILSPKGGDILYIGQKDTITWNQHGVDTLFVEYSIDDGAHWQTLNFHKDPTHVANFFVWTVAGQPTTQARIRLRPFATELATLSSISDPFIVLNITGGVNSSPAESVHISINPQPVRRSEQLNLNLKLDAYSGVDISLFDMSGKKVITKNHTFFGAGNTTLGLQLNSLTAGAYVLEVRRDDGMMRVVKVVVE